MIESIKLLRNVVFYVVFFSVFSASMSLCARELRIGTASEGGAFYPIGKSIAKLVNKYGGDDLKMVPVVTGGAVQNPRLIASGEVDVAITNNYLAAMAVNGAGPYKSGKIEIQALAALHPSILHMVAMKGSHINTIEDLRGKRVAVGPAGGGTLGFLNFLLPLHNLSITDIIPSFLSYSEGFVQLINDDVDAAFALSGYPAAAVEQASVGNGLEFITFSEGMLKTALTKNSAFKAVDISENVYPIDKRTVFIGVDNVLIVSRSMSIDVVEKITSSIFDHLDELQSASVSTETIHPAKSKKLSISLHPGAEKYFNKK